MINLILLMLLVATICFHKYKVKELNKEIKYWRTEFYLLRGSEQRMGLNSRHMAEQFFKQETNITPELEQLCEEIEKEINNDSN